MTHYMKFGTESGNSLLIELNDEEVTSPQGVAKAGLRDAVNTGIAEAESIFDSALKTVLRLNAEAFLAALQSLPTPPTELEVSFGIKATGEIGNFVITKVGGEANYSVKLAWKSIASTKQ